MMLQPRHVFFCWSIAVLAAAYGGSSLSDRPNSRRPRVHYYDKDFSLSEQNIKVSLSHPQLQGGQIGFDLGVKLV